MRVGYARVSAVTLMPPATDGVSVSRTVHPLERVTANGGVLGNNCLSL